ncbi:MAG: flagellar basal body rod protein FlgC [Alphaproteobacteria bacterium]
MDLMATMNISAGGMYAQSTRARVAAENIANADSVESADDAGQPYRAKQVYFKSYMNPQTGTTEVKVERIAKDTVTPLVPVYDPANKLADAKGFVMHPNVDQTVETVNMKDAQRAYEANMAAYTTTRDMASRTLDMLR